MPQLKPAVRAVSAMAHSDTPPLPITSAAVSYRCWLLLAPPTRWLQAMLRNPEVTTGGWSPSLCRSASRRATGPLVGWPPRRPAVSGRLAGARKVRRSGQATKATGQEPACRQSLSAGAG
jgi:hypothetical protein